MTDKIKIRITSISIPVILLFSLPLFPIPNISGSLESTGYIYSGETEDFSGTETRGKVHETLFLNVEFLETLSFHTNNRFTYRTSNTENPDRYELNLYYGYLDYDPVKYFNMQLGRIMDINSLVYSFYDGVNAEFILNIFDIKLTLDMYGGLVVNDDYLEDEIEPYGYNSFDYRNIFDFDKLSDYQDLLMDQRKGDYIGGAKANFFVDDIGAFGLDYQATYNQYDLAEQYVSVDFDTFFSNRYIFYGYGVIDLIDKKPSNTLAASRLNLFDYLSVIFEHEYFRPVYLKDSYFWTYFKPYGYQEASGILDFIISPLMTIDLKYGRIFYDAESEDGNEYSLCITHRGIYGIGVKLDNDYFTGPEGDRILSQAILNKRIWSVDFTGGGGIILYNDGNLSHTCRINYFSENYNDIKDNFRKGYFATLGADMNILKNLIFSADGEYYNNPKYYYDLRGILSLEYLF